MMEQALRAPIMQWHEDREDRHADEDSTGGQGLRYDRLLGAGVQ